MLIFSVAILAFGVFDAAAVYRWVPYTAKERLPEDAIIGGKESDERPIYVGRTLINEHWLTVKFIPAADYAAVSFEGKEIPVKHFELLTGAHLEWVRAEKGNIPPRAVLGGRTQKGEAIYIGRAPFKGSVTVGWVLPSKGGILFPSEQKEHFDPQYQILVES